VGGEIRTSNEPSTFCQAIERWSRLDLAAGKSLCLLAHHGSPRIKAIAAPPTDRQTKLASIINGIASLKLAQKFSAAISQEAHPKQLCWRWELSKATDAA
jgi:hypothetical protein